MSNRTYKLVDVVGTSEESVHQAVQNAIARAGESLKGLGWFEVSQIRGRIRDGNVSEFQVTVKIGFQLLNAEEIKAAKHSHDGVSATVEEEPLPPGWYEDVH